jgi:hypothetical protein
MAAGNRGGRARSIRPVRRPVRRPARDQLATISRVGVASGKQLFPGFGVLDENRAHRTVLRRLQDRGFVIAGGIRHLRLAIIIHTKRFWRERFAHLIADADLVVDPDLQLSGHRRLLKQSSP